MTCEYSDGLKISYCGPLRINKPDQINVFLDRTEVLQDLPQNIQGELIEAVVHEDCNKMKLLAEQITESFGTYVPETEVGLY